MKHLLTILSMKYESLGSEFRYYPAQLGLSVARGRSRQFIRAAGVLNITSTLLVEETINWLLIKVRIPAIISESVISTQCLLTTNEATSTK